MTKSLDALGVGQPITRRDFIGGVATGVALLGAVGGAESASPSQTPAPVPASAPIASTQPDSYPPLRSGLRGQYPGSFEISHLARDGKFDGRIAAEDTGEHFDLVVVGAGISGLSAAHFYRKALGEDRRVLILDNHDDFGGHAKRCEFHHQGRVHLSFGGTMSIESPFPYSFAAKAMLAELGVDPTSFKRYARSQRIQGLGTGVFFDREHFAGDALVPGWGERPTAAFFAAAPLSATVRADLIRLYTQKVDYLPDLNPAQKAAALKRISYQDFLLKHAGVQPASLAFFNGIGWGIRNHKRLDTCPAYSAWRSDRPGFDGMQIEAEPKGESDYFHFPDGNASITRLIVSRLVPGVFAGRLDQESIVLAPANYANLDLPSNTTRIRLNSTVVRVEHVAAPDIGTERAVRIVYTKEGRPRQVTAANVVLACFNNILPYIVPSLPAEQKQALHYASKVPMQYTSVLLRNWEPFKKLGVHAIHAPNGYHPDIMLDTPLSIGGYETLLDPGHPAVIQMIRNFNKPGLGLPRREQNRAGRAEMLATSFETIELEVRRQLNRMLGPAGFDARRDILGLTINRWPHGYAYTYDTLGDPDVPDAERPHVLGRRAFGRITIANADAGAAGFTNVAIDQAERAVQECLLSRGLT